MKKISVLSLGVLMISTFSLPSAQAEKCSGKIAKGVADSYREKTGRSLRVDSVEQVGPVEKGQKVDAYGKSCTFAEPGVLFQVVDNDQGGTGISLVTADSSCRILQICQVYAE